MPVALPISRQWVTVLNNGTIVIDWGNNQFQDLVTGEFLTAVDLSGSHAIQDDVCTWLEKTGCIQGFDRDQLYISNLPQRPTDPLT